MNQIVTKKVIEILEGNGIVINEKQEFDELTSLQYISSLVEMEEEFDIEFPDEFLLLDNTHNIDSFVNIIEKEIKDQSS